MQISDAIKEAWAVAPSSVVILHTIELRHPSFVDANGLPTAIRATLDRVNTVATLEKDAPQNPGATVTFIPLRFELTLPKLSDDGVPTLQLTIDNVGEEVVKHLDAAIEDGSPIGCSYRAYISTDKSAPHHGPFHFTLGTPEVTDFRIVVKATFDDEATLSFPGFDYRLSEYPGLIRK